MGLKVNEMELNPRLTVKIEDSKITLSILGLSGKIISQIELSHEDLAVVYRKSKYRRKKARREKREIIF